MQYTTCQCRHIIECNGIILAANMIIAFIKANANNFFDYEFDRYFNNLPITVMLDLPKAVSKNPSVETSHV